MLIILVRRVHAFCFNSCNESFRIVLDDPLRGCFIHSLRHAAAHVVVHHQEEVLVSLLKRVPLTLLEGVESLWFGCDAGALSSR